jgi:hypothetical protein
VIKKSILGLAILGIAVASAATSAKVVFHNDVVINGSTVKAGEYKVEVNEGTATLKQGKTVVEAHVKLEDNANKFSDTTVKLSGRDLDEIRIGGTRTRIVFEHPATASN